MNILVTGNIPEVGILLLKEQDFEVDVVSSIKTKKDLIKCLKSKPYDGMITLLTNMIDEEVIDNVGNNMKIIANYAVGFNNISVNYAKEKGIEVTNTPGVLTNTVAEHTVALMFAVATRIVEADSFTRSGKFKGWEPDLFLGLDLLDKKVGILGAGRIGGRVAEIVSCMGMKVLYYDINRNKDFEKKLNVSFCPSPEDLIKNSDVVSVHLPLNISTHHFLDKRRLGFFSKDSILINTSRGAVIDEKELVEALSEKRIFGAGLDVFENEPEIERGLKKCENVIMLPHIASASIKTRNNMATIAAKNVISVLLGGEPINPVS